jgi:hypothetical protein
MQLEDAYYTDRDYMSKLGVEILPPVPFGDVIGWMSKAYFNPVLTRPTFNQMQLVTPRFFETPASSTIPLFGLDEAYVQEIYGEGARDLVLPAVDPQDKIVDIHERPGHYSEIVAQIRAHLASEHSQRARVQELIDIIES